MPHREKVEEWARDFKAYVDELNIARDDYRGIMEYIEDALALLREQEPVAPTETEDGDMLCGNCGETVGTEELNCGGISMVKYEYCPHCGKAVKWDE